MARLRSEWSNCALCTCDQVSPKNYSVSVYCLIRTTDDGDEKDWHGWGKAEMCNAVPELLRREILAWWMRRKKVYRIWGLIDKPEPTPAVRRAHLGAISAIGSESMHCVHTVTATRVGSAWIDFGQQDQLGKSSEIRPMLLTLPMPPKVG